MRYFVIFLYVCWATTEKKDCIDKTYKETYNLLESLSKNNSLLI